MKEITVKTEEGRAKPLAQLLLTTIFVVIGQEIYQLALPLALYKATGSSSTVFVSAGVSYLPNLLLALLIGTLIDRFNRKHWTIYTLLGQAVGFLLLSLLMAQSEVNNASLIATIFLIGVFNYCFAISRTAVVKEMLSTQQILIFNSQSHILDRIFSVLAPITAGVLVATSAPSIMFMLISAIYFLALLTAFFYKDMPVSEIARSSSFLSSIKEGMQILYANAPLWKMMWIVVFANIPHGVIDTLMIYYMRDQLQFSEQSVGVVFSAGAVGAIVSSLFVTKLRNKYGLGRVWISTLLINAILLPSFLFHSSLIWIVFLFFIFYCTTTLFNLYVWTYRQESTDSKYIGRVAGLTGSAFKLLLPIVLIMLGTLGEISNYLLLFWVGAGLLALTALPAIFGGLGKIK